MKISLLDIFEQIAPMSNGLKKAILDILHTQELALEEYLVQIGQKSDKIYFLEQGMLGSFHFNNGEELCSWVMTDGDIVVSIYSFFSQQAAEENIQALEPCSLKYIYYDDLERLYKAFPEFNYISRKITETYYMLYEKRSIFLRKYKAEDRIRLFLEHEPKLAKRLSGKMTAAYLHISQDRFYRLRSSIVRKK